MAPRNISTKKINKVNRKRPGVHSKNASKSQTGYKNKYKGQGR
jgi:hypothetical protein